MPDVSIVLPMYRTAAFFPELHRRLVHMLEARGTSFELVVVDDACPAGSGEAVRAVAATDDRVCLVSHRRNLGQQATVMNGLRHASGAVVVTMDADLQDVPEDVPLLLDTLRAGPVHAVFAGRRGKYQSIARMLTSRLFKRTVALLLGVPSDAGSFVAMSRTMVDMITRYDGANPYLLALVGGTGLPVTSVPVPRSARPSGRSAYTTLGRAGFALRAFRTAMAMRTQRAVR